MRSGRWKRIACAACLTLAVAFAYGASASVPRREAPVRQMVKRGPVLRGTRLLTLGGYELNVAFTTGGRVLCFDISTS